MRVAAIVDSSLVVDPGVIPKERTYEIVAT